MRAAGGSSACGSPLTPHRAGGAALVLPPQDPAIELQYKVCYARILDSKRRFLEAALR